jgi:ABC-2 type transport system permease protein
MTISPDTRRMLAVMHKEWLEIRQGVRQGRHSLALQLATQLLTGVVLGSAWHATLFVSHLTTFGVSIVAVGAVLPIVGDAIAGERERHTLETLLAFPVPMRALLAGKLAVLVLYAWVSSLIVLATATVTAAVASRAVPAVQWHVLAACLTVPVLVATAFAAAGLLMSGVAQSARGAQQQLAFVLTGMMLLPLTLFRFLPRAARVDLLASLQGSSALRVVALVAAGLVLIDLLLTALLFTQLTRRRLLRAS